MLNVNFHKVNNLRHKRIVIVELKQIIHFVFWWRRATAILHAPTWHINEGLLYTTLKIYLECCIQQFDTLKFQFEAKHDYRNKIEICFKFIYDLYYIHRDNIICFTRLFYMDYSLLQLINWSSSIRGKKTITNLFSINPRVMIQNYIFLHLLKCHLP